jgi:hypothetical protein
VFRTSFLVSCALILGAIAWFVVTHSYSLYDDAYIYFRYVENLHCGLRYTCGDPPVEGFTSPLWLLVLAMTRIVTRDLETSSQLLGAAALAGALLFTMRSALHPRLQG